jgi:hypothetical protein
MKMMLGNVVRSRLLWNIGEAVGDVNMEELIFQDGEIGGRS